MGKRAALLLIAMLAASSLIMIEYAFSQSIPKPSVPEFTVKYIDSSYYVPPTTPTTTIDPYTGQTITQGGGGGYVEGAKKIEIRIKNQPVTNNSLQYFFNVRVKGHFSQDWTVIDQWDKEAGSTDLYVFNPYPEQNYSSQYTILTYHEGIPSKGQMDFQVRALIGHVDRVGDPNHSALYNMYYANAVFTGESSDWSDTQTISIGESQMPTSPPATPTPTSSQEPLLTPEQLQIMVGVIIAVAVLGAGLGLLIYLAKRK
ncbi:MAG: hypothetical protein NWE99_04365 [Candidatus Bathyarchaeota archaeon]|nr:hypothetical protein [Candidatus Bathyarchaeota archaeon]